jgi:hypothetical protein
MSKCLIPLYAFAFVFAAVFLAGAALVPEESLAYVFCGLAYTAIFAAIIKELKR